MSKLLHYWKREYSLSISTEELRKAGFRTAHYPAHVQQVVIGAKKK